MVCSTIIKMLRMSAVLRTQPAAIEQEGKLPTLMLLVLIFTKYNLQISCHIGDVLLTRASATWWWW